jgi:hypothetical protein
MGGLPYATAAAFRSAPKDRLAVVAARSGYPLSEIQRQFGYDRLLARCFSVAPDHWVLKGAGALLARLDGARHSKDIDLFYANRPGELTEALENLHRALATDLGDHFRFEVVRLTELPEAAKGRRIHVRSTLGPSTFSTFHVDVVVGTAMSGEPDEVAPLVPVDVPGLVRTTYRAFPIADHVADKLCATAETHDHAGRQRASTRVKDLVDLALIARTQKIIGPRLRTAIQVGFAHRGLAVPARFAVPDEPVWRAQFPRVARDAPPPRLDYDGAVALVRRLLDPLLSGADPFEWDPDRSCWN